MLDNALVWLVAAGLVTVPAAAFALIVFKVRTLGECLRAVLAASETTSPEACEMAIGVFSALGKAALLAGVNGACLGLLHALFNASWPEVMQLGLSVAGISLMLGIVFRVAVAAPLETKALRIVERHAQPA